MSYTDSHGGTPFEDFQDLMVRFDGCFEYPWILATIAIYHPGVTSNGLILF